MFYWLRFPCHSNSDVSVWAVTCADSLRDFFHTLQGRARLSGASLLQHSVREGRTRCRERLGCALTLGHIM